MAGKFFPSPCAFAHHDNGIADFDLGVHHGSIRPLGHEDLGGAERLLREFDQLVRRQEPR